MTSPEITTWLATRQLEMYKGNPSGYIHAFRTGSANRAIIRQYYSLVVRKRPEMALELMEPGYKQELKQMALEYAAGNMDLTGVMDMAKLIHLIAQNV